ncbi:MAG: serine/threonine-protein kinase [Candidatus Xenobia bacterium]
MQSLLDWFRPRTASRFGNLRIERMVACGHATAVYRVRDAQRRVYALKVLPQQDATLQARFRRELKLAKRLSHPHLVRVESVHPGGLGLPPHLVMEWLEGDTLAAWLEYRVAPVSWPEAQAILRPVLEALQAVHAAGAVHRDVHPNNVMVRQDGHVTLMDLGLASYEGATGITTPNEILGVPAYLAPEQIEDNHQADARSDLYAVGVMAYRMLAGRIPFPGRALTDLVMAKLTEPPLPLERFRPDLEPAVVAQVMRMMARRPADRPASAAEAVSDW